MMAGKRSMRRTTSLTEFALPDVGVEEDEEMQLPAHAEEEAVEKERENTFGWAVVGGSPAGRSERLAAYRARAAPTHLALRRNSAEFSAAAFLRACGLCNRRLGPGCDTFMYRGDTAFCSLECREQHITVEEWKEKCTALAAIAVPAQADVPVEPASERANNKSDAAATTAGGGGGMLAAA